MNDGGEGRGVRRGGEWELDIFYAISSVDTFLTLMPIVVNPKRTVDN